jgi:hypothetical protein
LDFSWSLRADNQDGSSDCAALLQRDRERAWKAATIVDNQHARRNMPLSDFIVDRHPTTDAAA